MVADPDEEEDDPYRNVRWTHHDGSEHLRTLASYCFCDVIDGNAPGRLQGLPRWLPTLPQVYVAPSLRSHIGSKIFNSTMLEW